MPLWALLLPCSCSGTSQTWTARLGRTVQHWGLGNCRCTHDYINKAPKGADGRGIIIPWADLRYILGEITKGSHITDFWDRRTNTSYLLALVNKKLLNLELVSFFSPTYQS